MADETDTASAIPRLEDWQHWTLVMGRAQQMLMEAWADEPEDRTSRSRPGRRRASASPTQRARATPTRWR